MDFYDLPAPRVISNGFLRSFHHHGSPQDADSPSSVDALHTPVSSGLKLAQLGPRSPVQVPIMMASVHRGKVGGGGGGGRAVVSRTEVMKQKANLQNEQNSERPRLALLPLTRTQRRRRRPRTKRTTSTHVKHDAPGRLGRSSAQYLRAWKNPRVPHFVSRKFSQERKIVERFVFGLSKNLFQYKIKVQWKHDELTNKPLAYTRFFERQGVNDIINLALCPHLQLMHRVPQHFRRSEMQAICYCCFGSCLICGHFPWPGVPRTVRQQVTECGCVALSPDFPFHRHLWQLPAQSAGWLRGRWPDFVTWAKGPVWNN